MVVVLVMLCATIIFTCGTHRSRNTWNGGGGGGGGGGYIHNFCSKMNF